MATLPVFLVERLPATGESLLDGPEGKHAATARRLRAGEQLLLTNGNGGLARCEVTGTEPSALRLVVLDRWDEPAPRPRVVLAQALVKGDRGELAVELATEAGVDGVLPWRASRCVARWDDGQRGARAHIRWQAAATRAAKQARRAWVPEVADPVGTAALADIVRSAACAVVLHESACVGIAAVDLPTDGELVLVVGPEGGVSDAELATLTSAGATAARLGSTVLRASTAAAVALGALGVLTGRWDQV